jgi:hypothetical protein
MTGGMQAPVGVRTKLAGQGLVGGGGRGEPTGGFAQRPDGNLISPRWHGCTTMGGTPMIGGTQAPVGVRTKLAGQGFGGGGREPPIHSHSPVLGLNL